MLIRRVSIAALSRVLLVALSCILAADGQAQAQDKPKAAAVAAKEPQPAAPKTPEIPWIVNCTSAAGKMSCETAQTLTIRKTGQLLLSISVRVPEKSKPGAIMLHLPHGMFLPDGVSMTIDGKALPKQPVQTCDEKGCYVGLPIDAALLKSMETGKTLLIGFKSLDKKDITVPISLSGFKEAYKKLL